MMNFETTLKNYILEANNYLESVFADKKGLIYDAVKYSLFSGGKRIRPVISLATSTALDGDKNTALVLGCAIEMIHTYSLIHDDLPCMDNDDLRRGKPTNHIVFGEDTAVLAGDALLNFACESIVNARQLDAKTAVRGLKIIYCASGVEGMIGGQVLDMLAEKNTPTKEELSVIHKKKTGALIKAAASVGALSANENTQIFSPYAEALGTAFQIRDDILDVSGDEKKLGKRIKSDEKNSKATYVTLYGLDNAKKRLEEETKKAISSIDFLGEKGNFLRELAYYLLKREF